MNQSQKFQSNNHPVTSSQLTTLRNWYECSIGYQNAMWYVHMLKRKGVTVAQASQEMDRLAKLRMFHGASAMKPKAWDKIKPSPEALEEFWQQLNNKPKEVING